MLKKVSKNENLFLKTREMYFRNVTELKLVEVMAN